jgi:biopolymer transport protein ExbD
MKLASSQHASRDIEIDMAPMIDCVFILLIFFIVTSVFVDDPGVTVEKPDVRQAETAARDALLVAITADNQVYFDGQRIGIDEVAAQLRRALVDKDTPVIICADRASSHGTFAAVYSEAKRAGVGRVQFSTTATSTTTAGEGQ